MQQAGDRQGGGGRKTQQPLKNDEKKMPTVAGLFAGLPLFFLPGRLTLSDRGGARAGAGPTLREKKHKAGRRAVHRHTRYKRPPPPHRDRKKKRGQRHGGRASSAPARATQRDQIKRVRKSQAKRRKKKKGRGNAGERRGTTARTHPSLLCGGVSAAEACDSWPHRRKRRKQARPTETRDRVRDPPSTAAVLPSTDETEKKGKKILSR
nr:hypothetical protein [Pandoravirus massiliensis]